MHFLKLLFARPIFIVLFLIITLLIIIVFYKRGKLNKVSINKIIAFIAFGVIFSLGLFYYNSISSKKTSYQPARIIDGQITK
ncbi:MAG: hypothetical protein ISQ32_02535 [Rickettsiales bacterium]|nr:hypothetical protein [Rickettsiales bacterium]